MRRFTGSPVCGTSTPQHPVVMRLNDHRMLRFQPVRTPSVPLSVPLQDPGPGLERGLLLNVRTTPRPARPGGTEARDGGRATSDAIGSGFYPARRRPAKSTCLTCIAISALCFEREIPTVVSIVMCPPVSAPDAL